MSNNNNTVDVLLPTGTKVPMRGFTTKEGKQSKMLAVLGTRNDGSRYYTRNMGVNVKALAKHVPERVTVLGVDVDVIQPVGFYVHIEGKDYPRWENDPAGEPKVNDKGFPQFHGSTIVEHNGERSEFKLRITDKGEVWNIQAELKPKKAPLTDEQKHERLVARALSAADL